MALLCRNTFLRFFTGFGIYIDATYTGWMRGIVEMYVRTRRKIKVMSLTNEIYQSWKFSKHTPKTDIIFGMDTVLSGVVGRMKIN